MKAHKHDKRVIGFATIFTLLASFWFVPQAHAVPAFARQTGLACFTCHFQSFPKLNAFGRQFKAGGFVMTGAQPKVESEELSIPATLNASIYTKIRYQKTNGQDVTPGSGESTTGTNNGELQFPDETVLKLGGRVGEHIGFVLDGDLTHEGISSHGVIQNFKMPFTYDVSGTKLAVVPFTSDGGGVAYGFELLNTGATELQRSFEHGRDISAQQFFGTTDANPHEVVTARGPDMAQGFAFAAWHPAWFANFSLWEPEHGAGDAGTHFSHYLRAAATPQVGGWDLAIGAQYWGGETKFGGSGLDPSQIYVTKAWTIDGQAQGSVGALPLGVYVTYGVAAKGQNDGKTNLFNPFGTTTVGGPCAIGCNDKKAFTILGELGVVPNKLTLGLGYRTGDNGAASNNKDDSVLFGLKYLIAQNVQIQFDYSSYSGSAYDKSSGVNPYSYGTLAGGVYTPGLHEGINMRSTLMLFAAF